MHAYSYIAICLCLVQIFIYCFTLWMWAAKALRRLHLKVPFHMSKFLSNFIYPSSADKQSQQTMFAYFVPVFRNQRRLDFASESLASGWVAWDIKPLRDYLFVFFREWFMGQENGKGHQKIWHILQSWLALLGLTSNILSKHAIFIIFCVTWLDYRKNI